MRFSYLSRSQQAYQAKKEEDYIYNVLIDSYYIALINHFVNYTSRRYSNTYNDRENKASAY